MTAVSALYKIPSTVHLVIILWKVYENLLLINRSAFHKITVVEFFIIISCRCILSLRTTST